jgi:hypothetical protein
MFGAPLLGPGHDALDTIRVAQHINNRGVKRHLDASVLEQTVAGLAQHQGIVVERESLAETDRIGHPAPRLHHSEKAVGKSEHDFLRRSVPIVRRGIEPAHRAG